MQNMRTDWKGLMMPIQKLIISVTEVMVIDTAASLSIRPIRSGTDSCTGVLLHAPSITNVSSMPMPGNRQHCHEGDDHSDKDCNESQIIEIRSNWMTDLLAD
jgi:hypothetical protein